MPADLTEVEELQEKLRDDKLLRLDFYAAVAKVFRDHGYDIDIKLLLSVWLAGNPLRPQSEDTDRWGEP